MQTQAKQNILFHNAKLWNHLWSNLSNDLWGCLKFHFIFLDDNVNNLTALIEIAVEKQ